MKGQSQRRQVRGSRKLRRILWGWPAIGTSAVALYSVAANAIYGHDWILAFTLELVALLLLACKALTWKETKNLKHTQVIRATVVLTALVLLGFSFRWAYARREHNRLAFHIMGENASFSSQSLNQLIANVYLQNDGDDADIAVASTAAFGPNKESEQAKGVTLVKQNIPPKADLMFRVHSHEARWFTVQGPLLSDEVRLGYLRGDYIFYFAGKIYIKDGEPLSFCAFVIGSNPHAIVECPSEGK